MFVSFELGEGVPGYCMRNRLNTSLICFILAHDSASDGMIGNHIDDVPEVEDPRIRNTLSFVEIFSSEGCSHC